MSLEENKPIVRSLYEALNKHNPDLLDEFMALDYVDAPNTPYELRGLESVKQYYADVYRGFPNLHLTIEDIVAEGDKVAVRFKGTGTHTGEWFGIAPTGKKIAIIGVLIYRIVNGKIMEKVSGIYDFLDFYKQIGVIEITEKGKKLFPEDAK